MAVPSSLVQLLDPPALGKGNPVFSNIAIANISDTTKLVTIAGQVATTPSGEVPSGLRAQMESCLKKISICLEASGARMEDMTRLMYYVTEQAYATEGALSIIVDIAERWLQGHRPASCFLVVKSLSQPEFLCEFEAQAVVRRTD